MIAFRIEMLLKRAVPMLLAGMLVLPMTQASTSPDTGARLAALADRYFENRLRLFSPSATGDVGDPPGTIHARSSGASPVRRIGVFDTPRRTSSYRRLDA